MKPSKGPFSLPVIVKASFITAASTPNPMPTEVDAANSAPSTCTELAGSPDVGDTSI